MTNVFLQTVGQAIADVRVETGVPVTYRRGEQSVAITATESPKDYVATTKDGITTTTHSHDWLIVAGVLILGGAATKPQAGDQIVTAAGEVHEAMQIPGRNVYDSGVGNFQYRVHTKLVAAETDETEPGDGA